MNKFVLSLFLGVFLFGCERKVGFILVDLESSKFAPKEWWVHSITVTGPAGFVMERHIYEAAAHFPITQTGDYVACFKTKHHQSCAPVTVTEMTDYRLFVHAKDGMSSYEFNLSK